VNDAAAEATRRDRAPTTAILAGLAAAAAGGAWILATFTRRPWHDFAYHVPLAFVVTAGVVDAWLLRRTRTVRGFLWCALLAGVYTVGRIKEDWFASGHAVLGVLFAVAAPRAVWRPLGVAVALQALITKAIDDERPMCAVYGAAFGLVIGLAARRIDRGPPPPTTPS
jgi:hypothetical protein